MVKTNIQNLGLRNFVGGLLGGILGIWACAAIHPIALVAGCFLGATCGFWHREIWRSVVSLRIPSFLLLFLNRGKNGERDDQKNQREKWVWTPEKLQDLSVGVIWLVNIAGLAIGFRSWYTTYHNEIPFGVILVLMLMVELILLNLSSKVSKLEYPKPVRRYVRRHPVEFFLKSIAKMFGIEIVNFTKQLVVVLYTALAVAAILLVTVFGGIPFCFLNALYWASKQRNHWFCFGITIVTTSIVAWLQYQFWQNPRMIWVSAVGAGFLSGTLTFMVQSPIEGWLHKWVDHATKEMVTHYNEFVDWFYVPGKRILDFFKEHQPQLIK